MMILSIFKCSVFSRFIKNIDQVQPVLGTLRCHDGRRQRERQNSNSARASHFLYISLQPCAITTGKCLISHFMEDVNKRRLNFLSLSGLEYDS